MYILYVLSIILMFIGLTTVLQLFVFKVCTFKKDRDLFLITVLHGNDAEIQLRDSVEFYNYMRFSGNIKLVAVDVSLDSDMKKIVADECEAAGIIFCKSDEIGDYLIHN